MNKCKRLWMFVLMMFVFASSCTIEKRKYTSGFHVEWFHHHKREVAADSRESALNKESAKDTLQLATVEPADDSSLAQNPDSTESLAISTDQNVSRKVKTAFRKENNTSRRYSPDPGFTYRGISGRVLAPVPSAELDTTASVLGIIAFALGILTLLSLVMALIVTEGWAALGWVAVMVIFGSATAIFGIIAQTIFWAKHQGVPWFQWLPLVISAAAIVILVKVLTGK